MKPVVAEGRCLCGRVRYKVVGLPRSVSICHCRSCRLGSGAPAVSWFVISRNQYELLAGELAQFQSSPPVTRGFCRTCGTPLTYEHEDAPSAIEITTATLSDPESFVPTKEIWLSEKLPWVSPDPSREHFPRGSHEAGADAAGA